jgi:hypothetical protein
VYRKQANSTGDTAKCTRSRLTVQEIQQSVPEAGQQYRRYIKVYQKQANNTGDTAKCTRSRLTVQEVQQRIV